MIDLEKDVVHCRFPDAHGDKPSALTHEGLIEYLMRKFNRERVRVNTFTHPWAVVLEPNGESILFVGMPEYAPEIRQALMQAHRDSLDHVGADVCAMISEAYVKVVRGQDEYEKQKGQRLEGDPEAKEHLVISCEQRHQNPLMAVAPFGEDGRLEPFGDLNRSGVIGGEMRVFADLEPCH